MLKLVVSEPNPVTVASRTGAFAGALVIVSRLELSRLIGRVLFTLTRPIPENLVASRASAAERRRIIAGLHDGALQLLAGGLASLRAAERLLDANTNGDGRPQALQTLADGIQLVEASVGEIRSVLFPAAGPPATPKLAAQVQRVMQRFEPTVPSSVHVSSIPDLSSAPVAEQAMAGIIGEALGNALKHARPRNVWVDVSVAAGEVTGAVRDDGVGFDVSEVTVHTPIQKKLGLLLIQERARCAGGFVTIVSHPGTGTTVEAHLPLRPQADVSQQRPSQNGAFLG